MSDILCVLPEGVWCLIYFVCYQRESGVLIYFVCYQRESGVLYTLCATRGSLVSHIVCVLPEGVWCFVYFVCYQRVSGV